LPLVGTGALLAHLFTAAAFRRRTDALISRLQRASTAGVSVPPVPAIIQSFARRAILDDLVPNTVAQPTRRVAGQPPRPVAIIHHRTNNRHPGTGFCVARPNASGAARPGADPRLLCGWRGSAGSARLRFIALGAGSGTTGQQSRVNALPRRTRLGAAGHAAQYQALVGEIDATTIEVRPRVRPARHGYG
jgi:hypothetical protein